MEAYTGVRWNEERSHSPKMCQGWKAPLVDAGILGEEAFAHPLEAFLLFVG